MTLEDKIMADLKDAMKAKDQEKLTALRGIKSAILLAKTEKGKTHQLSEADELRILQKLVKQRNESAAIYKEQGRQDLYEKEMAEAKLISSYLPAPLSADELKKGVQEIIAETGASGIQDMGRVMKEATRRFAGRADGATLSSLVRELLA